MQYGITKTTKYQLIDGSWHKVESWTDPHSIIDFNHWDEWRRWDSNGSPKRASLRSQCGYMLSYTAYSPSANEKIKTELLRYISGGPYLSYFDNLDKISDKDFKKLERRAKECASYHGINFNESCFISSCGVAHGFYFPNSNKGYMICFCRGEAVLLNDKLLSNIEGGK